MTRPLILDLYCGAGGSAKGYHQAGFDVWGVDIEHFKRYPFPMMRDDALEYLDACIAMQRAVGWLPFQAVHASPPCQAWSDLQKQSKRLYDDLIAPTRDRLEALGLPYVIENVDGAPLRDPVKLCGASDEFPELRVIRHRLFEANWPIKGTECPKPRHPLVFTFDKRKPHHATLNQDTAYVQVTGGGNCSVKNAREAMGIDWMTKQEINEAIPPAYTKFIGEQLIDHISVNREIGRGGEAENTDYSNRKTAPGGEAENAGITIEYCEESLYGSRHEHDHNGRPDCEWCEGDHEFCDGMECEK